MYKKVLQEGLENGIILLEIKFLITKQLPSSNWNPTHYNLFLFKQYKNATPPSTELDWIKCITHGDFDRPSVVGAAFFEY